MTLLRAAARLGQPDASRVQNSSVDGDVSSSSLPPNHPPLQRADAVVTGGESCRARTAGGEAYLSASLLLLRYAAALPMPLGSLHKWKSVLRDVEVGFLWSG